MRLIMAICVDTFIFRLLSFLAITCVCFLVALKYAIYTYIIYIRYDCLYCFIRLFQFLLFI